MERKWSLAIIFIALYFMAWQYIYNQSINVVSVWIGILGISILNFREWARKAVIYTYIIFIILILRDLFLRGNLYPILQIIKEILIIINCLLIVYFFTRAKVKEQFKLNKGLASLLKTWVDEKHKN
jgi:hypothetical protein